METIETDRLLLRRATEGEAGALIGGSPMPTTPCAEGYPTPDTPDAFAAFLADPQANAGGGPWLVFRRADGRVIGDIGFDHEVEPGVVTGGYGFAQCVWGQGYATEAVRALVAHTLARPGVRRIVAETEGTNLASRRVLEKAGMRFERETGGMLQFVIDA